MKRSGRRWPPAIRACGFGWRKEVLQGSGKRRRGFAEYSGRRDRFRIPQKASLVIKNAFAART
ncbi:hypothetical protein LJK88_22940 [Paenibacillus sp. P26]|nr:hypothetical protein LJK88_22940 [Paenibacillus sp. P26]UUZ95613.1 hypothetical protein LJK87_14920 [Paenibacillus sp. P25]